MVIEVIIIANKPSFQRIFKRNEKVLIENPYLLSDDFIPEIIVARDDQISAIADYLKGILNYDKPKNIYVWGDTGVGKTITIKYVLKILEDGLKEENLDILINTIYINCTVLKNDTTAYIEILSNLTGLKIKVGKSSYDYLKDIWTVIDLKASEHKFYTLILIFDEIDSFIGPDDILYQFSRAKAHGCIHAHNTAIEIIFASNKKDFLQTLDEKVLSSVRPRFCDFPDYNTDELYEILQLRKEAFADGVITDNELRYCAKQSSERYHGDARRCLDILTEAASIAVKSNSDIININFIDKAEKTIAARATVAMLKRITLHDKILLYSVHIANEILQQANIYTLPHTGLVLETYKQICKLTDNDPNGDTYISSRIKSLDNKQILHAEFCKGHGNTKYIILSNDVDVVINDLVSEEFKNIIVKNYIDIETTVLNKVKNRKNRIKSLEDF